MRKPVERKLWDVPVTLSTCLPFFEVQVLSGGKMLFCDITGLLAMVMLNNKNAMCAVPFIWALWKDMSMYLSFFTVFY